MQKPSKQQKMLIARVSVAVFFEIIILPSLFIHLPQQFSFSHSFCLWMLVCFVFWLRYFSLVAFFSAFHLFSSHLTRIRAPCPCFHFILFCQFAFFLYRCFFSFRIESVLLSECALFAFYFVEFFIICFGLWELLLLRCHFVLGLMICWLLILNLFVVGMCGWLCNVIRCIYLWRRSLYNA